MKMYACTALFAIVITLSGCNTMKISCEDTSQYDFSSTKAYLWIDCPEASYGEVDSYLNDDIKKALNTELTTLGMHQVLDAAKADVKVAYHLKLDEQTEYAAPMGSEEPTANSGVVFSQNTRSWSYRDQTPDLNAYTVHLGTLSLLVYDSKSGERVWLGTLKTKIDRTRPLEKQQLLVKTAARRLVAKFPAHK